MDEEVTRSQRIAQIRSMGAAAWPHADQGRRGPLPRWRFACFDDFHDNLLLVAARFLCGLLDALQEAGTLALQNGEGLHVRCRTARLD